MEESDETEGALVRWRDNSICSPSSEMGGWGGGDTVGSGLSHPKQNRTGFECLNVNGSGIQEVTVKRSTGIKGQ